MRGPVRKELMKCFERELQTRCPQFKFSDSDRDARIWSWSISPELVFFVMVQAFERDDQFVVEVAWSGNEEFPWGAFGQLEVEQPEGRGRLGRLWESGPDTPVWDAAPEKTAVDMQNLEALREGRKTIIPEDPPLAQTLPRIQPLVADAVGKLMQYGMPLFHRVAEAHGVEWPRA